MCFFFRFYPSLHSIHSHNICMPKKYFLRPFLLVVQVVNFYNFIKNKKSIETICMALEWQMYTKYSTYLFK